MLLDSGCTQSVFPRSHFQKLHPNIRTSLHPVTGNGILADGTRIKLDGLSTIKFKIGQRQYQHKFLVADLNNHILLGLDFFEAQQCVLDFQKSQLLIQSELISCCDQGGNPFIVNVQAHKETVLPPRSEKLSVARLSREWTSGVACIETADRVPGVLVATTVQEPRNQHVQVRLLNYTDHQIVIPAGKLIASCTAAEVCELDDRSDMTRGKLPVPDHLKGIIDNIGITMNADEKHRVEKLLTRYESVFSSTKYDVGRTSMVKHAIPLVPGAKPLKQRPYRHGHVQEQEVEKQVKELQEQKLIREGHGAWSSPVVLVQKKDGSWRFCVDYRKLNEITHKDAYPLPRIDDSLDALGGSRLFSTLDLTSGYWQVELEEEAKERSAFVTRSGLWEWQVLPFGLTSAPSTFERLMETVLRGLHWKTLLIYLDDIIVFSKDLDSHLERLEEVLSRLQKAGLKLKPSKCKLFADKVHYLGHVVSAAGVETDDTKISAVKQWPIPKHKKDVRAFLGTCGYYRRFIHHYAEISRPLSQLSSKHAKFEWNEECKVAFEQLKTCLTTAPILAYPDHSLPFILDTDASQVGTGAVLSQRQNGQERVIAYYSKMYSKEEANYCVTRQEFLAIVKAVKHFRPLLYGREFVARTDHASLPWLLKTPNPAGQFARWIETLSEFSFQLLHRKGLKHSNADGLSRQVCQECKQCQRAFPQDGVHIQPIQKELSLHNHMTNNHPVAQKQKEDLQIQEIYGAVKNNRPILDKELGWQAKTLNNLWDHLRINDEGILQVSLPQRNSRAWRTVCPQDLQQEVIEGVHKEAHFGFNKTLAVVRQKWYWPGMTSHVRRWVSICQHCQRAKPAIHHQYRKTNKLTAGRPWQIVAVDLCGPLPETTRGNTQILVLADHFTRWYDAIPIPNGHADTVATALDERIFSYFGIPEVIHTDQGAQFESDLFTRCCEMWKCKKTRTAPYHPQGNSIVERLNKTIGNSLRAMLAESEHQEWDELIPQIMRTVRATPHRSTSETPNYLMLGRETRLPHDLLVDISPEDKESSEEEYVAQLQKRLQTAYERIRAHQKGTPRTDSSEEESRFKEGDEVWLKSYFKGKGRGSKLQPKYIGPYTITQCLPYQTYKMQRNGKVTTQHEGRIKICLGNPNLNRPQLPSSNLEKAETNREETREDETNSKVKVHPLDTTDNITESPPLKLKPKRDTRVPPHLRNYWLDCLTTNIIDRNSILGQNPELGGSDVVKE